MKKLQILRIVLVVLGCLTWCQAQPVLAQSEVLSWKLEKGQSFKLVIEQKMKQVIKGLPTGDQEMPMSTAIEMTWNVTDSNADGFTVEQIIDRFQMSMDSAMFNIDFDSADKEAANSNDPMTKAMTENMGKIVGQKFIQTMNRRGEITNVEVPPGLDGGQGGFDLTGDAIKQMTTQAALIFPEGPLSVGKTWESNMDVDMNQMKMKAKNVYRYEGQESVGGRNLHKIHLTTETEIEGGPDGAEISIEEQDNQGTIFFDAKEGRIDSSKGEQNMVMSLGISGMSMTQEIKGTTSFKVTPVKK